MMIVESHANLVRLKAVKCIEEGEFASDLLRIHHSYSRHSGSCLKPYSLTGTALAGFGLTRRMRSFVIPDQYMAATITRIIQIPHQVSGLIRCGSP